MESSECHASRINHTIYSSPASSILAQGGCVIVLSAPEEILCRRHDYRGCDGFIPFSGRHQFPRDPRNFISERDRNELGLAPKQRDKPRGALTAPCSINAWHRCCTNNQRATQCLVTCPRDDAHRCDAKPSAFPLCLEFQPVIRHIPATAERTVRGQAPGGIHQPQSAREAVRPCRAPWLRVRPNSVAYP